MSLLLHVSEDHHAPTDLFDWSDAAMEGYHRLLHEPGNNAHHADHTHDEPHTLDLDDPASVERLAAALNHVNGTGATRTAVFEPEARAIIAALRGEG